MLMLLLAAAPPGGEQVTAEQALSNYRKVFQSTAELDCPKVEGEIVVCGNRGGRNPARLPLPVEREPGERVRGEASRDTGGCVSRCHQPAQVNILAIPGFIGRVIGRLKDD